MCIFYKIFQIKNKDEIENWLFKHHIKNFIINDDLTVDINGDVNLKDKSLYLIPIQFGVVLGTFDISDNNLFSLKGAPFKVGEDFVCDSNKLKTLKFAPIKIGKLCYVVDNPIRKIKQLNIECEEIEFGYIHFKKQKKFEIKGLNSYYKKVGELRHLKWFTVSLSSDEIKKILKIS